MNAKTAATNFPVRVLIAAIAGALIGALAMWLSLGNQTTTGAEPKPLYWVAPMDPNYQRDEPGKSPMGMDLIPVYADAGEGVKDAPGTVKISPEVVNNMGVRTAAVRSGRINAEILTVGYVEYDENRRVELSPRVEGWVEKLHIRAVGDPVSRGQPLYAIYSPVLVNAQEEYLLARKRKSTPLVAAAEDRLRALQVPEGAIKRLRESGRAARTITISAPQSGVVDQLMVREGMYVKPGMSLMSITMLEHVWVIGEVFERQAATVHKGDAVTVQIDYLPGREWVGKLDYIYPALNTKTRTAQVRVHVDNSDGALKPGMLAQMRIDTGSGTESLLLPREALIRTGMQTRVVLALGEGKYRSVAVKVGRISDLNVEVLSGLVKGDRVVTSAQFLIDSESSKTADLKRMTNPNDSDATAESVWVEARIESVMIDHRMVSLAHAPIEAWQWPAMTMNFTAEEGVDLGTLKTGTSVRAELVRTGEDDYRLRSVQFLDGDSQPGDSSAPLPDRQSGGDAIEVFPEQQRESRDSAGTPDHSGHSEHDGHSSQPGDEG